jgi:hypothetical protein
VAPLPITSVLPSRHDRRRLARRRLGLESLLHDNRLDTPSRRLDRPATARVYLDVSGSMTEYVQDFLGPLTAYVSRRLATLWQFSTIVEPLPLDQLRSGRLITTGGDRQAAGGATTIQAQWCTNVASHKVCKFDNRPSRKLCLGVAGRA